VRYECHNCGRRFEEPDIITETHGLDTPPYEKVAVCPYCHGYFEEMYQCEICGEWFTDAELTSGVCDECIYQYDTDVELCYKLGADSKESIKINGFIASVFSEEQINEILWNRIKEISRMVNVSCYDFIESDKQYFAEKLLIKQEESF
jgi:DNA-directed RNA polymerase subunit RPC12/RpoP